MIGYDDFQKLELRIGTVVVCEKVEGANKLLRLEVDLGDETRQIAAGMAETFEPGHLLGKQVPVLVNLEPRTLRGVESQGMILAGDVEGEPVLLHPEREIPPGSPIR